MDLKLICHVIDEAGIEDWDMITLMWRLSRTKPLEWNRLIEIIEGLHRHETLWVRLKARLSKRVAKELEEERMYFMSSVNKVIQDIDDEDVETVLHLKRAYNLY